MPATRRRTDDAAPLSPEQEAELHRFLDQYPRPAKLLYTRYRGVWAVAVAMGVTQDDLNQTCSLAAIIAVRKWDHRRGVALQSFAAWQMRSEVQKILKRERRWCDMLSIDCAPDRDDPRRRLGTVGGILSKASEREEEKERAERSIRDKSEAVERLVARLPPRSRLVMDLRRQGMTLAQVGVVLGVTKERVRQIHKEAKDSVAADCARLAAAGLV